MWTVRLINYFGLYTIPSPCRNCCSTPSYRWQRQWLKYLLFKCTIVISIMSQLWANSYKVHVHYKCMKVYVQVYTKPKGTVGMSTVNFLWPNFNCQPLQYHIGNRGKLVVILIWQFCSSSPNSISTTFWTACWPDACKWVAEAVLLFKYLPRSNGPAMYTVRASSLSRRISRGQMKRCSIFWRVQTHVQ